MRTRVLFPVVLGAALVATAAGREVRFEDCPPAVRRTITVESKGGRIDEIDFQAGSGRYVAGIDFPRNRESTLEIAANGRVMRKIEDIARAGLPKPVRKAVRRLQGTNGRVDDLERETVGRRITYRVEIDFPNDRDQRFTLSRKGAVLKQSAHD